MKNLFLRCCTVFLVIFSLPAKGVDITAGVSSIDITPPLEMKYTLGGYGERMNKPAEAIHDHIWAKALVVKYGAKKYVLITLDVLGLPANVKPDLIKRISNRGWTAENMMLLPSHSHGSLEMEALNSKNQLNNPQLGIFQPELLEFLVSKLETLVKEAEKNDQPVKIGTGSKILEGLNRNRRKDPEVDNEMTVTRIDLLNGKHLAVLVNWTAHPTFIGGKDMLVSAEWPGYLQKELQQRIGGGVTAMYYNGAEGDQSPVLNEGTNGYEKIQIYGEKIADMAIGVFNQIKPKKVNGFTSGYRVIKLPEHMAHPSFMKTGGEEYGLNENTVKIVMNMLAPAEVGIGAFKMGDFMIAGVPGEMTAVLGLNVKNTLKSRGVKYATIGGLANEWISYILSREQYLQGEGYESSVSFFGPGLGELMSDEVIKTAGKLTPKK